MKGMKNTDIDRQQELHHCSFVKTVLMILIVVYHSILFWGGNWFTMDPVYESKALGFLAQWMNTFHIYGFALVSGYLFYYLKHEKGKYQRFWPFVLNKAKRLLVPYLFVVTVWIMPVNISWREFSIISVIKDYLLGISPSQLWFLLMLFNVFVISWCLSSFFAKHNILAFGIALAMYGISIVGFMVAPNVFQIWNAFRYVLFFLIGFKIRQHGSKLLMKIPCWIWLLSSVLLFILDQLLDGSSLLFVKLLAQGVSAACKIVGAVMAFVVLQKLASKIPYQNSIVIKHLTKLSMPIYLFHQQFIYLFIYLLNGVMHPYPHAICNFIGAFALSVILSAFMMKFRVTRFLIGEKT